MRKKRRKRKNSGKKAKKEVTRKDNQKVIASILMRIIGAIMLSVTVIVEKLMRAELADTDPR